MAGMSSGGHRTSTIPRPAGAARSATAPTVRSTKATGPRVSHRGLSWLIGAVIVGAVVASLFVLPVKTWFRQRSQIEQKQVELAALTDANGALGDEIGRLNTPAGIEAAAREELGFVKRGEIRLTMLPAPSAPLTMPSGWPYDAFARIVSVRQQTAAPTAP
jgi:hypothetical protein